MTFSRTAAAFLLILVFDGLHGAGQEPAEEPGLHRFEFVEPHMGTQFRIVLYAPDASAAEKVAKAAFQRVAELDHIMSDYRDASELMGLCRQAGGPPVKVSSELFFVLNQAQEVAKQSDGAFDVTVGPVVRLWRRTRRQRELPDPRRLKEALDLVGYEKLRLDALARTVQLLKPAMLLDLGGIAKGHAADEAQIVLKKQGVERALVAAGGDIAVSGPPPGEDAWRVGIAPLDAPEKPPSRFLRLRNQAVSTSGEAEQFVEINGKRYSHLVDPKTGVGLLGRSSVTVVAPRGIISDSLATAVSVLGPERGLKLVEDTPGTSALIVQAHDNQLLILRSQRWQETGPAPAKQKP